MTTERIERTESWRLKTPERCRPTSVCLGGAERDRTADLLVANEALSQLSYSPPPCKVTVTWRCARSAASHSLAETLARTNRLNGASAIWSEYHPCSTRNAARTRCCCVHCMEDQKHEPARTTHRRCARRAHPSKARHGRSGTRAADPPGSPRCA